jgi:hypothetical protein
MPNLKICQAINHRRLLHFHYELDGRIVEPHAYGRTREGVEILNAYQVAGGSRARVRSRGYSGWKIYRVEEINRLKVLTKALTRG